jgi:hypothetical protein
VFTVEDLVGWPYGTMFGGMHIASSGKIFLTTVCVNEPESYQVERRWTFEGQRKYIKGLWHEQEAVWFGLAAAKDTTVQKLIADGFFIELDKPTGLSDKHMRRNGDTFYKNLIHLTSRIAFEPGSFIGLSLGKTIVALQPYFQDVYRPAYHEVFLLHKSLLLPTGSIGWIVFRVFVSNYRGYAEEEEQWRILSTKIPELL